MTKKLILILFVLLLAGCSGQFGADQEVAVDLTKMKEVQKIKNRLSDKYVLYYENEETGEEEEFIVTESEYGKVVNENKQPPKDGYIFKGGSGVPVYEIIIPELNDNEYLILNSSTTPAEYLIKLEKEEEKIIYKL